MSRLLTTVSVIALGSVSALAQTTPMQNQQQINAIPWTNGMKLVTGFQLQSLFTNLNSTYGLYGSLAGPNVWTGANAFSGSITLPQTGIVIGNGTSPATAITPGSGVAAALAQPVTGTGGIVLSSSIAYYYDTRAAAAAVTVPAAYNYITTGGYATRGDGGASSYYRSGSNPNQTGAAFQDASGQWWALAVRDIIPPQWGAPCNGTGDDTSGLQNALNYLGSQNTYLTLDGKGLGCTVSTSLYVTAPGSLTGNIVSGSGYASGGTAYYAGVALTGGSGSGATANIFVQSGRVIDMTTFNGGTGYHVGDVLSASNASLGGSGSGFSFTITNVGTSQWQSYRRRITNLNLTATNTFPSTMFFLDFSNLPSTYPLNDVEVDNNFFYGGVQGAGYASGGIKVSWSYGGKIHDNHIENVKHWGIYRIATTAAGELLIHHNVIRGDGVDGMYGIDLWGYDNTVDHNIISDADCGLISEQGSNYWDNNHVYNFQYQNSTCGFSSRGSQDTFVHNIMDMAYLDLRVMSQLLIQHNMFRIQFNMPSGLNSGNWCSIYLDPTIASAASLTVSIENNTFTNTPPATASFTGSIAPGSGGQGVLTVSGGVVGTIGEGQFITGGATLANTLILGQISGAAGGIGTYSVNQSQTVGGGTSFSAAASTIYDTCVTPSHGGTYGAASIFDTFIRNNSYYGWSVSTPRTTHPNFIAALAASISTGVDLTTQLIPNFGVPRYILNGAFTQTGGSVGGFWFSLSGNIVSGAVGSSSSGIFTGQATINNNSAPPK